VVEAKTINRISDYRFYWSNRCDLIENLEITFRIMEI